MKSMKLVVALTALSGCLAPYTNAPRLSGRVVPALEYSHAVRDGKVEEFSILDSAERIDAQASVKAEQVNLEKEASIREARGQLSPPPADQEVLTNIGAEPGSIVTKSVKELGFSGDPKLVGDGFQLKASLAENPQAAMPMNTQLARAKIESPYSNYPKGSSAPYYKGQMTSNASLWPDESQGASLFRDVRAFLPMDVVTIVINERSEGQKKAETDSETKFSLLAAISNFFGFEVGWASDNEGMDPSNLLNATTNTKFEGDGETKRSGIMKAKISAVVLEVLPNNLLRIEGTKIVSVDHEEEVMVISGLIRPRDVDSVNEVDSSKIANMRIDFYGRGILGEGTSPGWGARIFNNIWPF